MKRIEFEDALVAILKKLEELEASQPARGFNSTGVHVRLELEDARSMVKGIIAKIGGVYREEGVKK